MVGHVHTASGPECRDRVQAWLSSSEPSVASDSLEGDQALPRQDGAQACTEAAPVHASQRVLAGAFEDSDAGPEHLGHQSDSLDASASLCSRADKAMVQDAAIDDEVSFDGVMAMLINHISSHQQDTVDPDGLEQPTAAVVTIPGQAVLTQRTDLMDSVALLRQPQADVRPYVAESDISASDISGHLDGSASPPQMASRMPLPVDSSSVASILSNVQRVFFNEKAQRPLLTVPSEQESSATLQAAEDDDGASSHMSLVTPLWIHDHKKGYTGAPKPSNEPVRMARLCALGVLSTAAEQRFDRLTSFVARVR
jgi:hypothetical protein